MADPIAQARELLKKQIAELNAERARLTRALDALTGSSNGREQTKRTRRASRRGRPRRGRREQVLSYLEKNPGSKPTQIAKGIGISPNHAHGVLRKARNDKMVKKTRDGYSLSATAKATAQRQ